MISIDGRPIRTSTLSVARFFKAIFYFNSTTKTIKGWRITIRRIPIVILKKIKPPISLPEDEDLFYSAGGMGVAIRWIRESLHRLRGIPHVGIPQKRRREPHAVFYFELLALAHTHTHSHTHTRTQKKNTHTPALERTGLASAFRSASSLPVVEKQKTNGRRMETNQTKLDRKKNWNEANDGDVGLESNVRGPRAADD